MTYKICRCEICGRSIHVHKKRYGVVVKNLCRDIKTVDDLKKKTNLNNGSKKLILKLNKVVGA